MTTNPNDSFSVSYDTSYWQAVDSSRSGLTYDGSNLSYGEYALHGPRVEYDDPGTPTDGVDQKATAGFSTKIEAINRDLYTESYNVQADYVHTYSPNGGYDVSWDFKAFSLNPQNDTNPHWNMGALDEA